MHLAVTYARLPMTTAPIHKSIVRFGISGGKNDYQQSAAATQYHDTRASSWLQQR